MAKLSVIHIFISAFILQLYTLDTNQNPLTNSYRQVVLAEDDGFMGLIRNRTVRPTNYNFYTISADETSPTDATTERLDQATQPKHAEHKANAHDPEDILLLLIALILLCIHLFFMDMFVRLARTRFQTNSRFRYLSTIHLFLAFLICVAYFLLIMLHYRDTEYCG